MGNQLAQPQRFQPEHLQELPKVVYKQTLGGGRVLKTVLCIHDQAGLVVVKVYYKKADSPDLKSYEATLGDIRTRLSGVPSSHVWPFQYLAQGDRAAFLIRQHVFANLHIRLSTRPFLSDIEKLWIAFQLLHACSQAHQRGVQHGDIKCENVLVTSWNWAFLTDFAPFKPTHLPADNPADFSFYFDTGGRRRCYLAPERFVSGDDRAPPLAPLQPAMDIFSVGCTLAELFMDGTALFDLSKLLSYRAGDYDPASSLNKVEPGMRGLILHMIQRDPEQRLSAEQYLAEFGPRLFPAYFSDVLHPFFASILHTDVDARVHMLRAAFPRIQSSIAACTSPNSRQGEHAPEKCRPAEQDQQPINGQQEDGEAARHMHEATGSGPESAGSRNIQGAGDNFREHQPGSHGGWEGAQANGQQQESASARNAEGMILVAALLCTLMRGAKLQESRARAVAMLSQAAKTCDDDTRLQRIVPYLLALVAEQGVASVRCGALWCLGSVLSSVTSLPPSDAKIFNEYILPSLSLVPHDAEASVRVQYSAMIVPLAVVAHSFLMRLQVQAAAPAASQAASSSPHIGRYEEEARALQGAVRGVVTDLVAGQHATPVTKRALLHHMPALAHFLGRQTSNDFLLPTMITFLNDREWRLRAAFFSNIACMGTSAGFAGLEAFLLPCLEQALADPEEAVIAEALGFLSAVTHARQLRRRSLFAAIAKVCPRLLQHPAASVRACALSFVAAVSQTLSPAEAFALLLPNVESACSGGKEHAAADEVWPAMAASADLAPLLKAPLQPAAIQPQASGKRGRPAAAHAAPPATPSRPSRTTSGSSASSIQPRPSAAQTSADPLKLPRLANVALYSVPIDPRHLKAGRSHLRAALASLPASRGRPSRGSGSGEQPGWHLRDTELLVAHARRSNQPTAALASMQGRLAPHVALGSEEALSFQAGTVPSAVQAAISTGFTPGAAGGSSIGSPAASSASAWHPRGVLVAHLAEHKRAVNALAVLQGGAYVVSASSDETCKVWDCRRLERDVSFRSRLTYDAKAKQSGGKMLSVAACEGGQSVASASSSGTVCVWHVEYTTRAGGQPDRYTGIQCGQQLAPEEGAVLEVQAWGVILVSATQQGRLHGWDVRMPRPAWTLSCKPQEGLLTRFALDPIGNDWLATGTRKGVIGLWDMRFQVRVGMWVHPAASPIEAVAPAVAPATALGLRQTPAAPLLYVAAGQEEVGLWDVAQGRCHQVLHVAGKTLPGGAPPGLPAALQMPAASAAAAPPSDWQIDASMMSQHLATHDLVAPPSRPKGCRALLPTGAGALLTGSTSGAIRLWNAARAEDSYMLCGPAAACAVSGASTGGSGEAEQVSEAYAYSMRQVSGLPVVEESTIVRNSDVQTKAGALSASGCTSAINHTDGITQLTAVDMGSDRCLLSCSTDGTVKAWK